MAVPAPFPKRFRAKYKRQQTGCLTCRRRRKRCDEAHPECQSCRRNHVACTWSELRPGRSAAADRTNLAADAACLPSGAIVPPNGGVVLARPLSPSPAMRQAFERAPASAPLYDFFAQNTCHALSLKPAGKDVFARHVVQLSCSDEVMAHCVLALGGVHLNWNNQADWQTQCSVSAHYSFVLAGLRKDAGAVRKADAVQCLEVAFKILTVCHIEVSGVVSLYMSVAPLTARSGHERINNRRPVCTPSCRSATDPGRRGSRA